MPNENELTIGVGLSGFEQTEARLERLEALLERSASTANRAFSTPSSSVKDFAVEIAKLDREITSLAGRYGSLGRAGASGFDQITDQQVKSIDKLTQLQSKLREVDKLRAANPNAFTKSGLVKDFENLEAQVTKLQRSLYSLQTFDVAAKLKGRLTGNDNAAERVTFAGPASPYTKHPDKAMQVALADIDRMQKQRKKLDEEYTTHVDKETDKQYKLRTSRFRSYLADTLSGLKSIASEDKKASTGLGGRAIGRSSRGLLHDAFSELGLGGLSGALGPVAIVGAVGIALKKFYDVSAIAIERASEQARANRTLASSATEAGISVEFLTKKNKEFAESTAISDVKAASTVAKITQLATLSQRPKNIDQLIKGFANLGAARGLDPLGIETVVQQIITGQDEGYKKLLLPNPQQLQKQYIKQHPELNIKSVEALTSVQRAQIFQDAFLSKAALFNGAAESRLESLDGKAAKLNASFENLANTLSTTFASSYDTQVTIEFVTKFFKDSTETGQLQDIIDKARKGQSYQEDLQKLSSQKGFLDYARQSVGGGSLVRAPLHFGAGAIYSLLGALAPRDATINKYAQSSFSSGFDELESFNKFINPYHTDDKKKDFYQRLINADLRFRATLERVGLEQRIRLAEQIAEEEKSRLANIEKDKITSVFSDRQRTIESVQTQLNQLKNYQADKSAVIDTGKLETEVNQQFNLLSPEDLAIKYKDLNDVQIKDKLREQLTKEFQATIDVENSPLFDKKAADQLIKQGVETLSDVVEEVYKRTSQRLRDPETKLIDLKKILGDVRQDARLLQKNAEDVIFELESQISKAAERNFEREFKKYQKPQGTLAQVRAELTRVKADKDLLPEDKLSLTDNLSDFIEDSVTRGKAKVKELGKQYRDEVFSVFSAKADDNPIARLFIEGDQAIIKLKDSLAGLSPEFTNKLLAFQQSTNELKVFKEQLKETTESFDLLKEARQFSSGRLDSDRSKSFQRAQTRRDLDAEIRQIESVQATKGVDADKRLRAIDQAIIQITRGLDPRYLSRNERNIAAESRRREADAIASDFKNSQNDRQLLLQTQQALVAEVQKLNKLAESGGIQLIIKIENDAKDRASVSSTPHINGVNDRFGT